MNKRFVFFYAFICVILLTVSIYVANYLDKVKDKEEQSEQNKQEINQITKYIEDNKIKDVIKVKITSTGEVKELTVSEYLKGVLPSEMPPEYDMEALKAQAVVARTYLYQKIAAGGHDDADICDSPAHCQAYYSTEKILEIWERSKGWDQATRELHANKVAEAVDSTENIAVTYNGEYIRAYFHACSGGKTEDVSNIWGKQEIPYLISVESLGEEDYKNYSSTVKLTVGELQTKLNKDTSIKCSINVDRGDVVKVLSYTDTGRVDKVEIGGVIYTAEKLRTLLGLRSTNFKVEYENKEVTFNVTGNGHGVGMSQVGANYYAEQGYTFDEIITHYYTGVDVTYINREDKTNEI
ncbi:MAG: stage II sporulation protein D [Clostridia bacterium]|nr:stage II sporulation protein D [Clostridia bacterium]